MSFFKAIAHLCASGVTFNIKVEAADAGMLAVQVMPTSKTGKSGFNLTGNQFIATAEELDAEFGGIMMGYAAIQQTLAQQLKAVELVAEETAKAAVAAAKVKSEAQASASASKTVKGIKSNKAPAGLLEDGPSDDEGGDDDQPVSTGATPVAETSGTFTFDL